MKTIILAIGLIFAINSIAIDLHSQVNLKEMRKKEKERRKKLNLTTKPGERSVERIASTKERYGFTQIITRGGEEATASSTEKKRIGIPEKRDPKKSKEYWQDRKKRLDSQILELETGIKNKEAELNRLRTQYYNLDMAVQQNQMWAQMDRMLEEIEKDKAELTKLRADLDGLSEEARKAGIPSGWVR